MSLKIIWRKTRLYKRFEMDIWGFYTLGAKQDTRIAKLFMYWAEDAAKKRNQRRIRYIYRIDLTEPSRVVRRQKWDFTTRKLSRLFYLTLSYAQFRKLAYVASRREGSWESNFILLVENRLIFMLYRMQVSLNVFDLRFFVICAKLKF